MSNGTAINSEENKEISKYAIYIFNTNKHCVNSECADKDFKRSEKSDDSSNSDTKLSDSEQSNICLSLLETNLGAMQETVVRCHLLKVFSVKENSSFENEGKYVVLKFNEESEGTFGCYYFRLCKLVDASSSEECAEDNSSSPPKKYTFFICLIGPDDGVMESFCSEMGTFCCSLLPLLDIEGTESQSNVQEKLKNWYDYCIKYIERCVKLFQDNLIVVLQAALHGKTNVICDDKNLKWDLERLVEACSLCGMLQNFTENASDPTADSSKDENEFALNLEVKEAEITCDKKLPHSEYCKKWLDTLSSYQFSDYATLRNVVDRFQLKTIQDLNTVKRLLQQAENDHYAYYKAYKFLMNSGYSDILIHHVKQEANFVCNSGLIDIISSLEDYINEQSNTLPSLNS